MKKVLFAVAFAVAAIPAFATIIIVDINGAGQFTSIQLAIDNSLPGDTIQVWPGTYNGAININKNVVLQGSGYENTIITSSSDPTITMSNGLIKWFFISSTGGHGINISGGKILNNVIKSCSSAGIYCHNSASQVYVSNCIVTNNGWHGIYIDNGSDMFVVNTISRNNGQYGFAAGGYNSYSEINRSYSNGSVWGDYHCSISNGQGCIDTDPIFVSSTNYHLSTGSPCFNTGQPSLSDPDGSVSDMGYFGGPDCPIFPVVYEMTISPNGNNINVQAKARANY